MKLRLGSSAAAGGDLIAMAAAAMITLLNGLAFGVLCLLMFSVILLMIDPSAFEPAASPWIAWIIGAWLIACANIVIGTRAIFRPSCRRLAWLYGSTSVALLLYPGTQRLPF